MEPGAQVQDVGSFESLKELFCKNALLEKNFSGKVLAEAKTFLKEDFATDKSRENFCNLHVLCIDPDGARDHDDAISIEETKSGYVLGVHIADVGYFVKENSKLDKEALKRAYTQYLPWTSFPMLPELLSSGLCSLKENEIRPSFSCIISLDKKGKMLKYRFVKGLIKVKSSITYKQAMELLENKDKHICLLEALSSKLKKNRTENGILEMGTLEYKCEFSKNGTPLKIVKSIGEKSNSWIEECMLTANKCCALEMQKRKLAGIYRVHEAPSAEDISELLQSCPSLFTDSPIDTNKFLKKYNNENSQNKLVFKLYAHLIKKANNNPILINKILRSMQKANYSAECKGHFALHFEHYAHFTSPIRRYADLWCHRELVKSKKAQPNKEELVKNICDSINDAEIKNQKTERKALKFCTSYILQKQIGQTFSAEILGIEEFGMFISISNTQIALADGLVHLRDIPGDFYVYNAFKDVLVGRRSGKTFKIGDKITVRLIKINVIKGENDFEIVDKSSNKKTSKPISKKEHIKKERRYGRR